MSVTSLSETARLLLFNYKYNGVNNAIKNATHFSNSIHFACVITQAMQKAKLCCIGTLCNWGIAKLKFFAKILPH